MYNDASNSYYLMHHSKVISDFLKYHGYSILFKYTMR